MQEYVSITALSETYCLLVSAHYYPADMIGHMFGLSIHTSDFGNQTWELGFDLILLGNRTYPCRRWPSHPLSEAFDRTLGGGSRFVCNS